jgi:hypothetical protein
LDRLPTVNAQSPNQTKALKPRKTNRAKLSKTSDSAVAVPR